ncbi:hypothetical protein V6N11_053734 [Hibiscus sabdariffa]|uniref:Chlorophyll a-b binding protein, chloroplastic n=1 Tax=Hibiscus sabdariffa TaxID=183260 RepID=A0ABR2S2G0_9ROSI
MATTTAATVSHFLEPVSKTLTKALAESKLGLALELSQGRGCSKGMQSLTQRRGFTPVAILTHSALASDPEKFDTLKLAEIKHSRLAMVAFLILGIQAAVTGKGPISFIASFNN